MYYVRITVTDQHGGQSIRVNKALGPMTRAQVEAHCAHRNAVERREYDWRRETGDGWWPLLEFAPHPIVSLTKVKPWNIPDPHKVGVEKVKWAWIAGAPGRHILVEPDPSGAVVTVSNARHNPLAVYPWGTTERGEVPYVVLSKSIKKGVVARVLSVELKRHGRLIIWTSAGVVSTTTRHKITRLVPVRLHKTLTQRCESAARARGERLVIITDLASAVAAVPIRFCPSCGSITHYRVPAVSLVKTYGRELVAA